MKKTETVLIEAIPAMRMMLKSSDAQKVSVTGFPVLQLENGKKWMDLSGGKAVEDFYKHISAEDLLQFGPAPLTVTAAGTVATLLEEFKAVLGRYRKNWDVLPRVICVQDSGIIFVGPTAESVSKLRAGFQKAVKTGGGGSSVISNSQRKVILAGAEDGEPLGGGRVDRKVAVITGGGQGFGAGIADKLFWQGANVVIADINDEAGKDKAGQLNAAGTANRAVFVRTDVSKDKSVVDLVARTVREFGGIDIFISNAGILRAGGLDEMDAGTFELMTAVNYSAYFLCAKYASAVMKTQSRYAPDAFFDIIQINSKSGLEGSRKNFAYAGGKFGGIGLTQSFALELMEHRIKVNSICPGNFFDGPLWSDPKTGLFVQYLKAGKVEGARNIADIRKYYESLVPAGRGCEIDDIMKAIYYVIDQKYETGQAVPVTGGQIMLS